MKQVTQQTQTLTEHLQKKSLDLVTGSHLTFNTIKRLQEWRNDDNCLKDLIKVSLTFVLNAFVSKKLSKKPDLSGLNRYVEIDARKSR